MAFSLDRILKALLFGASGPLSIKDIQKVFSKFHELGEALPEEEPASPEDDEEDSVEQPFLEGDGMPTSDVPSLVSAGQIRESIDRIAAELEERDEVYRLVERHNGFLLVTASSVGEWIRLLRDEPRPLKLSQSALETLAVIAYRQPVVRSEVEKIRGVSIDFSSRRPFDAMIGGTATEPWPIPRESVKSRLDTVHLPVSVGYGAPQPELESGSCWTKGPRNAE